VSEVDTKALTLKLRELLKAAEVEDGSSASAARVEAVGHTAELLVALWGAAPGLLDALEAAGTRGALQEDVIAAYGAYVPALYAERTALKARVDAAEAERDDWKRRAMQHGCEEGGDVDCG
jgi:hypothetical protein